MVRTLTFICLVFILSNCNNSESNDNQTQNLQITEEAVEQEETNESKETSEVSERKIEVDSSNFVNGYFTYFADAALFFPCGSEKGIPVKGNEEYLKMENAYIRFENLKVAEKVYCKLEGRYNTEKGMEEKMERHLIVNKFHSFQRGKNCE